MAKAGSTRYYKRLCALEEQAFILVKLLTKIVSLLIILMALLHT